MDALILSCSTGGGHNAAGNAVREELQRRGHQAEIWDPYELVSNSLAEGIGNTYIKTTQKMPVLFGLIYLLGEGYRRLPFRSPVYFVNRKIARLLEERLREHPVDLIVMPHLFPAEVVTYMKRHGMKVPKTVFIATDYACIPFTEETDCDYYIIPNKELLPEFTGRGIPKERLIPLGIPVSRSFLKEITKEEAKKRLGFSLEKHYILVSGGSIGAGNLEQAVQVIYRYMEKRKEFECIVICGNNECLYHKLKQRAKSMRGIYVLKSTSKMYLYMKASDVFISKPGGLSSTEAAAMGTALIHISPIPGCEFANRKFFEQRRMCIAVGNISKQLIPAVIYARKQQVAENMKRAQRKYVNGHACEEICDWLEDLVER